MARILVVLMALGAAVAAAAAVWPAGSQAAPATPTQRTFVSTQGSDANPCSRAEPCRNFAAALPNTLAGGEVVALDSGGYGPFTVDKAVTVAGAPGAHVAVTAFSGDAIVVDAGSFDTVVLRNLYLTGIGEPAAGRGIVFQAGATLMVDSVVAGGFEFAALNATAAGATLIVSGSRFRNSGIGVNVAGSLRAEIEGTRADQNSGHGFAFSDGARGSVDNSYATGNPFHGFLLESGAVVAISNSVADGNFRGISVFHAGSVADVTGTAITNNPGAGLLAAGPSVARIGGSTVTANGVGLEESLGAIETYADNLVHGNSVDVSGTLTVIGKT